MSTSYRQDAPPKGGYGEITWRRHIPVRGYNGAVTLLGVFGLAIFNFNVGLYTRRKRHQEEWIQRDSRKGIEALLQAEKDREMLRRLKHNEEAEAAIFADNPSWVPGATPYHSDRFYGLQQDRDYARLYKRDPVLVRYHNDIFSLKKDLDFQNPEVF